MSEQDRMENFYQGMMPKSKMSWDIWAKHDNGEYLDEFAQLAWAAWQAAQYAYAEAPLVTEAVKQLELELDNGQGNT